MKPFFILWVILCWFAPAPVLGQTDFRAGFESTDPVAKDSTLTEDEKLQAHQIFLESAMRGQDPLQKIYGNLFLSADFIKAADFSEAFRYVVEAEAIAKSAKNNGWLGWVTHRKGVIYVKMKDYEKALEAQEAAAALCGEAKDSLCLAESLEQVSIMYGMLDDFEKAREIHRQAMPLLKKFGGDRQLATALSNFGSINSLQKHYSEAIEYFQQAIEIQRKVNNAKGEAKALNNLAFVYTKLKKYELAIETFQQCIRQNQKNNIPENLVRNYLGMGATYEAMGDCGAAKNYFDKYYSLKDSLIGAETKTKIAELEIKYETQQKELELNKNKLALGAAERSVERRNWLIILILLLIGIGLWRWRLQLREAKHNQIKSQENLASLTKVLLEKNKQLAAFEEKILESRAVSTPADFEENLFNQNILTDADWSAFKIYFENAHPGFLQRLRTTYPALSDAEERLFLFIKMNLTTKEAATILGISADSVKKTRNRLRKRLSLEEEVDLWKFIHSF